MSTSLLSSHSINSSQTEKKKVVRCRNATELWTFTRKQSWSEMNRQQQYIRHRTPNKVNAWILGSSIASLASAVHLISDANVPASQIHILESRSTPGDGITGTGDPLNGYDHRPGCLPKFSDGGMEKLLALVPSATGSGRTVLKDVEKFYDNEVCQDLPVTHILIQGDHGPKKMETRKLDLALKDRMKLTILLLRSEESLARKRINQLFNKSFFDSRFWTIFSTLCAARPKRRLGDRTNAKTNYQIYLPAVA